MRIAAPLMLALAALSLAGPAHADAANGAASADAPAKKEKVICKRETNVGSNIAPKVCKTQAEWQALLERERRAFQERDKD